MKNLKVFLIFLIFLTANSVTFAQKIGVVDTNYILSKMPQYTEAQARLEKQIKAWQTELQTLQAEYDAKKAVCSRPAESGDSPHSISADTLRRASGMEPRGLRRQGQAPHAARRGAAQYIRRYAGDDSHNLRRLASAGFFPRKESSP